MAKKLKWEGLTYTKQASAKFGSPVKCDGCEHRVRKAEIFSSRDGKTVWCGNCVAIVKAEGR
jgi:ribosomal protein S27E